MTPNTSSLRSGERLSHQEGEAGAEAVRARAADLEAAPFAGGFTEVFEGNGNLKRGMGCIGHEPGADSPRWRREGQGRGERSWRGSDRAAAGSLFVLRDAVQLREAAAAPCGFCDVNLTRFPALHLSNC